MRLVPKESILKFIPAAFADSSARSSVRLERSSTFFSDSNIFVTVAVCMNLVLHNATKNASSDFSGAVAASRVAMLKSAICSYESSSYKHTHIHTYIRNWCEEIEWFD